jgi:hypothetical protein
VRQGSGQVINIAGYYQITIAVSCRQIRKGMTSAIEEDNGGDQGEAYKMGQVANEQAVHS